MMWYFQPFFKFAKFSGRARRREYWTFAIINVIIGSILGFVGKEMDMMIIPEIFGALILIPSFAVLIRRLHDTGKGGGYLFIYIIPVFGQILMLLKLLKDSDYGSNKYGPSPKR